MAKKVPETSKWQLCGDGISNIKFNNPKGIAEVKRELAAQKKKVKPTKGNTNGKK